MAKKQSSRVPKKQTQARSSATRGGTSSRSQNKNGKGKSAPPSRAKAAPKRARKKEPFRLNLEQKALIAGIILIFLTAVTVLSLLSPTQGQLTTALANLMLSTFGWGGAVVPLLVGGAGFYLVLWGMEQHPKLPGVRLTGLILLFVVIEAFTSLLLVMGRNGLPDVWTVAQQHKGGGYLGGIVTLLLTNVAGNLGAIILLALLGLGATALVTGVDQQDLRTFWQMIVNWRQKWGDRSATAAPPATAGGRPRGERPSANPRPNVVQPPLRLGESPDHAPAAPPAAAPPATASPATAEENSGGRRPRRARAAEAPPAEPVPVFLGPGSGQIWRLPVLADMLEASSDTETNDFNIREHVEIIEHTLSSFGAPATVVEISQGPTVTQYGVEPQFIEQRGGKRTKVKVGKIASLADDLALALAARSIRIQAPVPGKGYVGIEVPNAAKSLVSLRDVMESEEFQRIKGPLRLGLGQNVAGQPISADLAKMPHLLVAGATGSGKSVCVNGIIACLLLQHTPDDLRFVMVDPKRVELVGYNGIPHLVAPVVVDLERVVGTLQWAMREMDTRYQKLSETGTRNIAEYNRKVARRPEREKLPYIVIIIDELADLMMMAPEDTEKGITRLAQMARATGIHMIIATQRPSVDVVTGLIKANFPARIAFAVASGTDSRVILDSTGAERLLGQGDMLFQSPDAAAPVRMQGCFVSDKELQGLINYWQAARRQNLIQLRAPVVTPAAESEAAAQPDAAARSDAAAVVVPPAATRRTAAPAVAQPPATVQPDAAQPPAAQQDTAHTAPSDAAVRSPARRPTAPPPVETTPAALPSSLQQPLWEDLIPEDNGSSQEDELMGEAVEMVRQLNKASTSLLQRRFRIGYTRAARLIDAMEEAGIIGPPTGTSKAREVLPWDASSTAAAGGASATAEPPDAAASPADETDGE